MEADARKWLQKKVETFLRRTGLTQGQTVLDFGCNEGNYTIPAARIVGERGKVYALDKNKDSLKKLMRKVEKKRLRNIKPLHVQEDQKLPLRSCCVDAVLLYDTLHGGYFPAADLQGLETPRSSVLLSDPSKEIRPDLPAAPPGNPQRGFLAGSEGLSGART